MIDIISIHYLISFGTVGILYNKKVYPNEDFSSWQALYQPKYKNDILLVDGAREIMGLALNKLGYSLNDTNPSHLKEAEKDLNHLTPQVRWRCWRRSHNDA